MTPLAVLLLAAAALISGAGAALLQFSVIGYAVIGVGLLVAYSAGRTERTWSKR